MQFGNNHRESLANGVAMCNAFDSSVLNERYCANHGANCQQTNKLRNIKMKRIFRSVTASATDTNHMDAALVQDKVTVLSSTQVISWGATSRRLMGTGSDRCSVPTDTLTPNLTFRVAHHLSYCVNSLPATQMKIHTKKVRSPLVHGIDNSVSFKCCSIEGHSRRLRADIVCLRLPVLVIHLNRIVRACSSSNHTVSCEPSKRSDQIKCFCLVRHRSAKRIR